MLEDRPILRRRLSLAATVILGFAILWATLTPQTMPELELVPLDKVAHAAAFGLLILPTAWGYPRALAVTIPAALLLGGAIELLQPLVGRGRELADFLMNVLGIGLGLLVGAGIRRTRA